MYDLGELPSNWDTGLIPSFVQPKCIKHLFCVTRKGGLLTFGGSFHRSHKMKLRIGIMSDGQYGFTGPTEHGLKKFPA